MTKLRTEEDAVNPVRKGLDATMKKGAELIVLQDINKMSYEEIAKELGVARSTLFRWKQRKDFNDYMNNLADEFQRSFLADAFGELRTIMKHGRTHEKLKAVELILKNQGRLKDTQEIKGSIETTVNVEDMLKALGV